MGFLTSALSLVLAPFLAAGMLLGSAIAPVPQEPTLGATESIPTTIAFFETTLAGAITSSATTFTLTSATDADGTTLASSTYAFVIDEGSSNEEIVIADCTGTACANALRGISVRTGNTEVTALKKAHRRGASVKITDAPILMLVARALRGESVTAFTPAGNGSLVDKEYVDNLALGTTTVAATTLDDGIVELATGIEAASSTATGDSGSPLTLHTGISTSTAPTTGSYVVVTGADGNIADGFISTTSVTQYAVTYSSTTVYAATTTAHNATYTYTKPAGLKFITVEMVGGGGGGGGKTDAGGTYGISAGGGGSGAYCKLTLKAENILSSKVIIAGAGGAGTAAGSTATASTGGTSSFGGTATTTGGAGGQDAARGVGGSASGACDISIAGGVGGYGTNADGLGNGAGSLLGIGGMGGANANGYSAVGYGAGGGGGGVVAGDSNDRGGGNGASGAVIITEYF